MQLAESFGLAEFLVSQVAARLGRVIEPTQEEIDNLQRLCVLVLQPLRDDLGRPVVVTSGLRPAWLNRAIGGSLTSAHIWGGAADIQVPGMTPLAVCRRVEGLRLHVDQCIHEFPPNGWCHVGIAPVELLPRFMMLTARTRPGGGTVYEPGLLA